MNLAFPILYVLATIVICGLPMIITPVETAIGLAMILSGNTAYLDHQGTTLEAAHSDMINYTGYVQGCQSTSSLSSGRTSPR